FEQVRPVFQVGVSGRGRKGLFSGWWTRCGEG
ncbi:hypothetical protein C5S35_17935, partial [Candidatus Methanophagaceae archaeon]